MPAVAPWFEVVGLALAAHDGQGLDSNCCLTAVAIQLLTTLHAHGRHRVLNVYWNLAALPLYSC
jgi:hypothetical protein